ncbi:MAG: trimethylamine methyltransferase [Chloroflexi bacterium]|jgi:trimethylamine---corrinoid protein Co-methyltransferase|nr:trimethylamine methyltransferase [Chloroflexota bacterium]
MKSNPTSTGGILGGQYQPLSKYDIELLHQSALNILEETGVAVHSTKALDLLEAAGARVDRSLPRAWLPKSMVEDAIASAPSKVELFGRKPEHHLTLGGKQVYLGTGGTTINVLDLDGVKRKSSVLDCHQIPRLVDALENVHFIVLPVYPNELTEENADVNRFYGGLRNSSKHIMGGMYSLQGTLDVIHMAEMIAGGPEALRNEPMVSFITLMISPLLVDETYGDIMIEVARRGLPLAVPCEPMTGSTSPVTLAGNLAMFAADTLAGVTLTQLANPGTPVLSGYVGTITDLRTMGYLSGAIESGLLNAGAAQLAQHWNLPFYATAGMSDSKTIDVQTGYESAMTTLLVALSGANYIHDAAGLMEFAMVASYEKYVIDNEIIGMALRALRGIEVTPETIAADLIHEAGPGGYFLKAKHTVKHMRSEFFFPQISDRNLREDWLEMGALDARQRANLRAREILNEHRPEPIPAAIDEIIRAEFDVIMPEL